ncbi:calcium load-activated calcium channel isoform X1 [Cuculus canorus]|uniref:calcium load-activated calcium channel isoform X1 n=1 Tax=Cuculus canorus TaxID=55661 RepID=UPI0023AAA4B3|nr:calcium load-activated calcium channel isoform X1 [Cuculus canorus]
MCLAAPVVPRFSGCHIEQSLDSETFLLPLLLNERTFFNLCFVGAWACKAEMMECHFFHLAVEKKKETITESAGRQQKKKIERQEEKLKNNNRDLSMVRMKSMFAIGFCFTALMGMFNSIFDGRVVAKLPFIPLSYIQGLSHRNLLGEDYTDCSFIFLYILCTMSIRQNIQKMLGLAPSRAATKQAGGFLGPPPQAGKFS